MKKPSKPFVGSPSRISTAWWTAILLAAFLIRLPFALEEGLTGDEVNYVLIARCSARDILSGAALDPSNPPLYMLLLHGLIRVAGDQVLLWKMMSVAMNIAAIAIMVVLVQRWCPPRVAIFSGLLAAIHPWQTYMATEVRGYALSGLLAMAALEGADRFERRGSVAGIVLWALACAAGFWTHYSGAVVALVTGIYLLIRVRGNLRKTAVLFAAGAVSLGIMLLWLPQMLDQPINRGGYPEHLWHLAGFPIVQVLGTTYLRPGMTVFWLLTGGMIAAVVYGYPASKGFLYLFRSNRSILILLLSFLAATLIVPLLRSATIGSIAFSTRYTFIANIVPLLLVAAGLVCLRPRVRLIATLCVVLLTGISLGQFKWVYQGRSSGREIVAKTLEETRDAQAWLFPNMVTAMRARFYSNGDFPVAFVQSPDAKRIGIVKRNATWLDVATSRYRSNAFFTQNLDILRQFEVVWYWSRKPSDIVPSILGPAYAADRTLTPLPAGGFGAESPPTMIRFRKIQSPSKTPVRMVDCG